MKRKLVYFFLIVIAIMVGHFVGLMLANDTNSLVAWLGSYMSFGFDTQNIDINVMQLSLGLRFRINFLQILLILLAIVMTPKISDAIK